MYQRSNCDSYRNKPHSKLIVTLALTLYLTLNLTLTQTIVPHAHRGPRTLFTRCN